MEENDKGIPEDDIKNHGWGYLRFGDLVIEPEYPDDDTLQFYIDYEPSHAAEEVKVTLTNDELHEFYYQLGMFLTNWNRVHKGIEALPYYENGKSTNGVPPQQRS